MNLLPRAFAIGCILEVLGALPFAFGAALGPCNISVAGVIGLVLHLPGAFVGLGLAALLGLPDAVGLAITVVAQALAWTALVYAILRLRLRLATRRANAMPTI